MKPYASALEKHKRESALHTFRLRAYKIAESIRNSGSYEEAEEWALEARTAEKALEDFRLNGNNDYQQGMKYVKEALDLADAYYATRKK
jgi:hypothetical protein